MRQDPRPTLPHYTARLTRALVETWVHCRYLGIELFMSRPSDLVQGTLDSVILRTLAAERGTGGPSRKRIRQVSSDVLQVTQGRSTPRCTGSSSRDG